MDRKPLSVHEAAELAGVTVRTLHYYDKLGLLKPSIVTEAKYRFYTGEDLARLQDILFYREVGFSLREIGGLLDAAACDREEALRGQREILAAKRDRIDALIRLVEERISGGGQLAFDAFSTAEIDDLQARYRDEAKARWGDSPYYAAAEEQAAGEGGENRRAALEDFHSWAKAFFARLGKCAHLGPDAAQVQDMVGEWQAYISRHFYPCDKTVLSSLGELYTADPRFADFINGCGSDNLAELFSRAIAVFCAEE